MWHEIFKPIPKHRSGRQHPMRNCFVTIKKETKLWLGEIAFSSLLTSPACFSCHVSVFSGFPTSSAATENTFGATMLLPQKFQNSRMTEPNRPPGDKKTNWLAKGSNRVLRMSGSTQRFSTRQGNGWICPLRYLKFRVLFKVYFSQ